jgi:nitrite reductase/ring-hydroxylating ferredoxin subunit
MTRVVPLCRLNELRDGASRGFDPEATGQDTVFVVRRGDRVYGYRDACPHWGGVPMAWRKDAYLNADGTRIVCAAHGAQFDVASGTCLLGPCLGQALDPIAVTLGKDGRISALIADADEKGA